MVNKTDYTVFNINNVFLLYCTDYDLRVSIFHEMGRKNLRYSDLQMIFLKDVEKT